jgi:hypothetical protein
MVYLLRVTHYYVDLFKQGIISEMKNALIVLFGLLMSLNSFSQCRDIYGNPAECPTEDDSLFVYVNALKVYDFYEKNSDYIKLKPQKLRSRHDVLNCFYKLRVSVDSFDNIWNRRERLLKGERVSGVLLPRDGKNIPIDSYYLRIDPYRFYQREFENGILNMNSPFPVYDVRIFPLIINSYENRYGNDDSNGDLVNVALYIPVTIKPFGMLTDSEKIIRKKILEEFDFGEVGASKNFCYTVPPPNAVPFYYSSPFGGGSLMGYMVGRKFRKYLPTDEYYSSLPRMIRDLLNDNESLERYLRSKIGDYYEGLL